MTAVIDEKPLEKMLKGVDIPPCPAILVDLDNELKKESPDQREVARLISKDVALSGRVMLIANSPAFSTGHKLSSIIQALNVLGTQQVFNLVVAQLLKVALAGKPEVGMDRFWESSAQTARLSAEIAKRLRCVRPDIAYTFGLFRDCGIPLLMKRFPQTREVLAEANAAEDTMFTTVEEKHLGTNHAVVGYFLAKRWRLPADVTEAMLHHHDYSVLGNSAIVSATVSALISVTVLAEHIIRLHASGNGEQEWAKASPAACAVFGMSFAAVDDLIEDLLDWLG
jgi:HD-like signal output (HDOD) protein